MRRGILTPLLFFFLLLPMVSAVGLYNNLSYNFDFNEGTGTSITSNGDLANGTQASQPFSWVTGIEGYGSQLSGNYTRWVTNKSSLISASTYQNFSVSLWFKPSAVSQNAKVWVGRDGTSNFINSLNYESGYFTYTLKGTGADYRYRAYAVPLPADEWVHVGVSVNDTVPSLFINGVPQPVTNDSVITGSGSSGFNFQQFGCGIASGQTCASPFNGTIDEVSLWQNRILTASEFLSLYNGGASLQYADYGLSSPTQSASITSISLGVYETYDLYIDSYFDNYGELWVSYEDTIAGATVFLQLEKFADGSTSFNTSHLNVTLTPLFDGNIRVRFKSGSTQMATSVTFTALNSLGSVADTVSLNTAGAITNYNPEQIASIVSPYTVYVNTNHTLFISEFFTNYNAVNLSWVDPFTGANESLFVRTLTQTSDTYTSDNLTVTLIDFAGKVILSLKSGDHPYITNFNLTVFNLGFAGVELGRASTNFLYQSVYVTNQTIAPPVQIANPVPIVLEANESKTIDVRDYAINYTSFQVYFADEEAGANVLLGGSNSYIGDNYQVILSGNTFRFVAKDTIYTQIINIRYINQFGDLHVPILFTINAGAYPTGNETGAGYAANVGVFDNLFPPAESLTLRQRFNYVFYTILIITLIFLILSWNTEYISMGIVLAAAIDVLAIIYFIAIHYIPVIIPVIFGVLGIFVLYLWFKGKE